MAAFKELKKTPSSFGPGNGAGADISDVVRRYIPEGTPFKEAQGVLQSAGFDVALPPPRPYTGTVLDLTRYQILAGTTLEKGLGYNFRFSVQIDPVTPGEAVTIVKRIRARISYNTL